MRLAEGVTAADKSAGQWQIRQPLILYKVIPNTQKAVATAGGFALMALVVTPVGKRVFLLIVTTITSVMRGMTPAATTVKKAAIGRSKSPPLAVKKHSIESPLPCHHQGARVPACCVLGDSGVFPYPSLGQQRVNDCRLYKPPICDLWGNLFFVPAKPDFFYRQRRTFCICPFSVCHQAGAAGCGGEYPRARSRDIIRHARTHRAKP